MMRIRRDVSLSMRTFVQGCFFEFLELGSEVLEDQLCGPVRSAFVCVVAVISFSRFKRGLRERGKRMLLVENVSELTRNPMIVPELSVTSIILQMN